VGLVGSEGVRVRVDRGPWRGLVHDLASIQRSKLAIALGLRLSLALVPPLVIGVALGYTGDGVSAAVGALLVGFVSFEGRHRSTMRNMALASVGVTISAFLGAVVADHLGALLVALFVWGVLGGLVSAFGPGPSMVAMQTVDVLVVFSAIAMSLSSAVIQALWVLAGALLAMVVVLLTWPVLNLDHEARAVGEIYHRLGNYAQAASPEPPPLEQLTEGAEWLGDPNPFGDPDRLNSLRELYQRAQDIRLALAALVLEAREEEDGGRRSVLERAAIELQAIAVQLGVRSQRGRFRRRAEAQLVLPGAPWPDVAEPAAAVLVDEIEQARGLVGGFASDRARVVLPHPRRPDASIDETVLRRVRALASLVQGDRGLVLQALRLGLVLVVGQLIASLLKLPNGYWIPMTAAVVLQGNLTGTLERTLARIGGTLIGAVAMTELAFLLAPNEGVLIVVTVLLTWATYATFRANYALYSVFLTSEVVVLFAMLGAPVGVTSAERAVATTIGALLALGAALLVPRSRRRQLPAALAAALRSQGLYLSAVLEALAGQEEGTVDRLRELALAARTARQRAANLVEELAKEPGTAGLLEAAGVLVSQIGSLALAGLALNAELLSGEIHRRVPDGLAQLVRETMEAAATALEHGELAPLPEQEVVKELAGGDRRLQEAVEAVSRVASLCREVVAVQRRGGLWRALVPERASRGRP